MGFLVAFLWVSYVSTHQVLCLQKRSDDVTLQSLSIMVQQQASTIQQLQASLTAVQNRMTNLETVDHQQATHLQTLDTRLNTRVAFSAHMSGLPVEIGTSNSPVVFDVASTNIGGAYDPNTGVFRAPVAGLYVFNAQLMNMEMHRWIQWAIAKGSTVICQNHLEDQVKNDKSSCEVTVHLNVGDTVNVKRTGGWSADQVIMGGTYCFFNGFLLSLDSP